MARPTDWSPLADSDPVPGDPQRIGEQAAHLASAAQQIQGQVSQLRAIAAGQSDERGLHVDKLKSASADVAGSLEQVVGRYQKTSSALSAWVPELEYAQSQSLKALYQAQDAAARERANQPIPWPSNYQPTAQDNQDDQARATALSRAADDLAAARAMLDAATSYRDQKGRETRNKIENAIHDGLADSWLDSHVGSAWAGFSDWVAEHADCLRTVANVASWIATGAGLLALCVGWIPIVGQVVAVAADAVATLAAAVSLVCHLLLAITGHGSWLDVALDAIMVITFGMGRAFAKVTKQGFTAARAASRAKIVKLFMDGEAYDNLPRLLKSQATSRAADLTGLTMKAAKNIVRDARNLEVPGWGAAALREGQNYVEIGKDLGESFRTAGSWIGRIFPFGDAGANQARAAFQYVVDNIPKAGEDETVLHFEGIADEAFGKFCLVTLVGTGIDAFDKASQLNPDLSWELQLWSELKDRATTGW
jgi:hypothetical protein